MGCFSWNGEVGSEWSAIELKGENSTARERKGMGCSSLPTSHHTFNSCLVTAAMTG